MAGAAALLGEFTAIGSTAAGRDCRYPLYRMHAERHICINTAAAGGNATLMALEG